MSNQINIYEPRSMAKMLERTAPVHTFFRTMFFGRNETHRTKTIDIDVKKGNRKLAPYVSEVVGGKTVPNTGYTTSTFTPPLLAPNKVTTAADLEARMPGEGIYTQVTPAKRAMVKTIRDMAELKEMTARRVEYMCMQAIMEGKVEVVGDGVNKEITFAFDNNEIITTTTAKWSDHANSRPLADIARYKREIQRKGLVNPDFVIMGEKALADFLENETVLKQLDTKNIQLALIEPKALPNGATYIGHLAKENLSIYTYNEFYLDDWTDPESPEVKEMMPEDYIVVGCSKTGNAVHFAALTFLDEKTGQFVTFEAEEAAKTFIEHNPDRRFIQVESRPLPVPAEADTWFVAKVR